MTPVQYIKLIDILESFKPKRICELGSGVSTNIFNTYCNKYNTINYSIEHDPQYNRYDSIMMPLIENSQLFNYKNCTLYKGLEDWLQEQDKFDLVLIDGPNDGIPFNNQNLEYARIQIFDFIIFDKLSNDSIIMYHDSEKEVAQRTLKEFEKQLKNYSKEIIIETDKNVIDYNKRILGTCPELTIYEIF